MKTYKYIALAALALGFTACSQDEDFTPQQEDIVQIASANIATEVQTRVNTLGDGTLFENADQILLVNGSRTSKNNGTYTYDGTNWNLTTGTILYASSGTNDFTAYYPASVDFTLPADQSTESGIKSADRMVATTNGVAKGTAVALSFERQNAKVTITPSFASQYEGKTISDITGFKIGEITPYLPVNGTAYTAILEPSETGFTVTLKVGQDELTAESSTKIEAGNHYTFSLTVGKEAVKIADINVTPWKDQVIDGVDTEECLHATWSGNKCTDCGATIEITGMKYIGDEAVYDAETNTYTILISPSAGLAAPHVQFIGKNLEYYSKNHPCAEMLMIYQSDTEFGDYEDYLYGLVYKDGKYIADPYSSIDGHFSEYQYSNDGGQTWSEEKLRTEIRYGYNVVVNESQNGTVTAHMTFVAAGWTVNLNVTPADGYMLDELTVTDGEDNPVNVENNAFTMPASAVTVNATFKSLNN